MQKTSIGNFLATLRRAKGLTQQEVADRLGISNRTLSSWETDRAYPDILLLPALADLYGVTADEIVRGERKPQADQTPQEQAEISEKSLTRILKSRHSRFVTQACIFAASLCMSAVVIFFGALLFYHIAGLIFCILGCAAFIAFAGLFIGFTFGAWNAAEGDSQTSANYRLCVAHTVFIAYSVCALCLFFLGIFLFCFALSHYDMEATVGVSLSLVVAAVAMLIGGVLTNASAINKYGSEAQRETKSDNAQLYRKAICFGLIPFAVALIFFFVCYSWSPQLQKTLYSGDGAGLVSYAETLVVDGDSYLSLECGVPAGEYPLDFSGKIERGEYRKDRELIQIDCLIGDAALYALTAEDAEWLDVYYVNEEGEGELMCATTRIKLGDVSFFDIRTSEFLNEFAKSDISYNVGGVMTRGNVFFSAHTWTAYGTEDGVYYCEFVTSYDLRPLGAIVGGLIVLLDAVVCISVCAAKRKKIKPTL